MVLGLTELKQQQQQQQKKKPNYILCWKFNYFTWIISFLYTQNFIPYESFWRCYDQSQSKIYILYLGIFLYLNSHDAWTEFSYPCFIQTELQQIALIIVMMKTHSGWSSYNCSFQGTAGSYRHGLGVTTARQWLPLVVVMFCPISVDSILSHWN